MMTGCLSRFTSRRRARRGFTMVELLLTVSLAAGGILAMVAMTNVKSRIMSYERDLAFARGLANSFVARLQGEAVNWTSDGDFNTNDTPLLHHGLNARYDVEGDGIVDGVWIALPAATNPNNNSPRFNSLGLPTEPTLGQTAAATTSGAAAYSPRYCIHYRLDWVADDAAPGELLNVQVRVFWPVAQDAFNTATGFDDCGAGDATQDHEVDMAESEAGRALFRFLQQSTVLYQHSEV